LTKSREDRNNLRREENFGLGMDRLGICRIEESAPGVSRENDKGESQRRRATSVSGGGKATILVTKKAGLVRRKKRDVRDLPEKPMLVACRT